MARKRKASPRPAAASKRRSGGLGAPRDEPEPEEEEEGERGREAMPGRALRHRRGLGPLPASGVSGEVGSGECQLAALTAAAPVREGAVTSACRRGYLLRGARGRGDARRKRGFSSVSERPGGARTLPGSAGRGWQPRAGRPAEGFSHLSRGGAGGGRHLRVRVPGGALKKVLQCSFAR